MTEREEKKDQTTDLDVPLQCKTINVIFLDIDGYVGDCMFEKRTRCFQNFVGFLYAAALRTG